MATTTMTRAMINWGSTSGGSVAASHPRNSSFYLSYSPTIFKSKISTTTRSVSVSQQQQQQQQQRIQSCKISSSKKVSYSFSSTLGFGRWWSKRIGSSFRCFSALTPELKTTLDKVVTSHKVVLFMKGTKEFPQCGFSNTVVQILKSLNVPFETLDILENDLLRQALKHYSNWPTFPQLYIDGEFFGGCDITVEAYKTGQLQEFLEKAMCS